MLVEHQLLLDQSYEICQNCDGFIPQVQVLIIFFALKLLIIRTLHSPMQRVSLVGECSDSYLCILISSSSLGEYVIGACLYFAKNLPRLIDNKNEKQWDRFPMAELRGSTMGIVGYGDIGRSCAKLAKAFGMRVLALRRRPELSQDDEFVDEVFGLNDLGTVMSESDYLVVCAALTPETRGLIGRREMLLSKEGQILINISRGAVLDELALIDILQNQSPIKGAALDVFTCEPLPKTSPLWNLPNVLLSPHNADMTKDFRHQSIKFFTQICQKFLTGNLVDCVVDKYSGY